MKDFKGLDDLVDDLDQTPSGQGTVIGRSIRVSGEIIGEEFLTVEGEIEGKIELRNDLLIKKNGIIKADIVANGITICGKVIGNINAKERIELKEDAKVIGDIRGPKIIIHEGAKIKGQIQMDFEMEDPKKRQAPQEQKQPVNPANKQETGLENTREPVIKKTETKTPPGSNERKSIIGINHNSSYERPAEEKKEIRHHPHHGFDRRHEEQQKSRQSFIVTKDKYDSSGK